MSSLTIKPDRMASAAVAAAPSSAEGALDAMAALTRTIRAIQSATATDNAWTALNLTMAQFKALALITDAGGLTSRQMADRLQISPSAVTPLVARLVDRRLVRREPDRVDRRVTWLRPTMRATSLWQKLLDANRTVLRRILETVPERDCRRVEQSLKVLVTAAESVLAKHKPEAGK